MRAAVAITFVLMTACAEPAPPMQDPLDPLPRQDSPLDRMWEEERIADEAAEQVCEDVGGTYYDGPDHCAMPLP